MAIALYMDENVPRQILLGLRLRGVDVLSVQEDKRSGDQSQHQKSYPPTAMLFY